jgi:hypothetical protein
MSSQLLEVNTEKIIPFSNWKIKLNIIDHSPVCRIISSGIWGYGV